MAKIIREDDFEEREVKDNDNFDLIDKAEELGIPFGCQDGRCGSCRIEVTEGMENLTERTQNELDVGFTENDSYRLICQCKIKSGTVRIRF